MTEGSLTRSDIIQESIELLKDKLFSLDGFGIVPGGNFLIIEVDGQEVQIDDAKAVLQGLCLDLMDLMDEQLLESDADEIGLAELGAEKLYERIIQDSVKVIKSDDVLHVMADNSPRGSLLISGATRVLEQFGLMMLDASEQLSKSRPTYQGRLIQSDLSVH